MLISAARLFRSVSEVLQLHIQLVVLPPEILGHLTNLRGWREKGGAKTCARMRKGEERYGNRWCDVGSRC